MEHDPVHMKIIWGCSPRCCYLYHLVYLPVLKPDFPGGVLVLKKELTKTWKSSDNALFTYMVRVILLFTLPEKMRISQGAAGGARWADCSVDKRCWKLSSKTMSGLLEKERSSDQGLDRAGSAEGWRTQNCKMIS